MKAPTIFLFLLTLASLTNLHAAQDGVILVYHHVDTGTPATTSISPADFRSHLEFLRDNDFKVIPLNQMVELLRERKQLPDKAIAITFDDGYSSIYHQAFPLLQDFGFPFTLFVSTEVIDNKQNKDSFLSWDQIREMSESGVIIANHTVNHPYMPERLNTATITESRSQWLIRLENELLQAEERIKQETGQSHRFLAYPYGEYNAEIKDLAARQNFTAFAQNSGAVGFYSDFLALPRFPLAGNYAGLDTASVKFSSKAFQVEERDPVPPLSRNNNPQLILDFEKGPYNFKQISCFANGQPIAIEWIDADEGILLLSSDVNIKGRKWLYTCTAPDAGAEHYYWYSVQRINPASDSN